MICKSDTSFSRYLLIVVILISTVLGGMFLIDTDSSDAESTVTAHTGQSVYISWSSINIGPEIYNDLINGEKIYSDDDYRNVIGINGAHYSVTSTMPIQTISTYSISANCTPISALKSNHHITITSNTTGEVVKSVPIEISDSYGKGIGTPSDPFTTLDLNWTVSDISDSLNEFWVEYNTTGIGQILVSGAGEITNVTAPDTMVLVAQGRSIICFGGVDRDCTITFDSNGTHYTATIHCANLPNLTHLTEGSCGDNLYYTLDYGEDLYEYHLKVYGTGTTMNNYSRLNPSPWMAYIKSHPSANPTWDILNAHLDYASNLTNVGDYAFYNSSYAWVFMSPSVTHLGTYSFAEGEIAEIVIWDYYPDDTVEYYIGAHAFENSAYEFACPFLGNATYIGDSAFKNSKLNTNYGLDAFNSFGKLDSMGESVFEGCTTIGINGITIKSGCTITELPANTFKGCTSLTDLTISAPLTTLGAYSFAGSAITNLTLPDSIEYIANYAFEGCTSLKLPKLPTSIKTIGNGAFKNCASLVTRMDYTEGYEVPNLTRIGAEAFTGCTKLNINDWIYAQFEVIGTRAFSELEVSTVFLNQNVINQKSDNPAIGWGNPFNSYLHSIYLVGVDNPTAYNNIPDSARNTEYTPWYINKDNLTNIRFEYSLQTLQSGIFAGMGESHLTALLPSYEIYVDTEGNIRNRSELNQRGIEIQFVDEWSTSGACGTDLTYSLQVNFIDRKATLDFHGNGAVMTNWSSSTSSPWMNYISRNLIPAGGYSLEVDFSPATNLTNIGDYAFKNCILLMSNIVFIDSITTIGNYAFDGCTNMDFDELPYAVEILGKGAFRGCTSLELDIDNYSQIPALKTIGAEAFSGCTEIDIDKRVFANFDVIGSNAFAGLGLTEVYLNQNVSNQKSDNNAIGWNNPFDSNLRFITLVGVTTPVDYNDVANSPHNSAYTPWCFNRTNLQSIQFTSIEKLQSGLFVGMGAGTLTSLLPSDIQYKDADGRSISVQSLNQRGIVAYISGLMISSGNCGDGLAYQIWSDGRLTITKIPYTSNPNMWDFNTTTKVAPWKAYDDIIDEVVFPLGLSWVGAYAFNDMSFHTLTNFATIEGINEYAFANCHNLTLTTIEPLSATDVLKKIGAHAFQNCENVDLSGFGKYIIRGFVVEDYVFDGSGTKLDGISPKISSIGDYAFRNTDSTFYFITDSLTSIGKGAFDGCDRITSVSVSTSTNFKEGSGLYNLTRVVLDPSHGGTTVPPISNMGSTDVPWVIYSDVLESIDISRVTHMPQNVLYHIPYSKIFDNRSVIGWFKDSRCTELADTFEGDEAYVLYLIESSAELGYGNDRTSMSRFHGELIFNGDMKTDLVSEFIIYPHDYIPPHNIISMVNIMKVIPVIIAISIILTVVGWLGVKSGRDRGGNEDYYDDSPSSRDPYMGH